MRWYHWILLVLVIIPLTLLAFVLGRRHGDLGSEVSTEMDALEARALAKRWKAELDAKQAADKVQRRYEDRIAKLDSEAVDEINSLRDDPVALADRLARLSD